MAYELIISNSDDTIRSIEFPSAKAAADAGRRVNFLGGCALAVKAGNDTFYAEVNGKETTFVMDVDGIRFHV